MKKSMLKNELFFKIAFLFAAFLFSKEMYAAPDVTDPRYSAIACTADKEFVLTCDYRYSARLDVKAVQLDVDGKEVQVKPESYKAFPASKEQSISILVLVDVSDPNRRNTVEAKYKISIGQIIRDLKPHQKIGLAEFDSEMRVLAPIGADIDSLQSVSQNLKATGQSTEFYKNILAAIDLLKKSIGDRKGLIILSDGKDEDRAYKLEDALKIAKESSISILSLGYLEGKQDSPFLQNLKRLADDTYGLYYEVTDSKGALPPGLVANPLGFVEKGGRLSFQLPRINKSYKIGLSLIHANKEKLVLTTDVVPPDTRTSSQKLTDFAITNWVWFFTGLMLFLSISAGIAYIIMSGARKRRPFTYATLVELNSTGTRHLIQQPAIRIGRGADNDIQLMNDSISSHHAEVKRHREGSFFIVDLASTNGVYVNEVKVNQEELKNNDIIELGEVRLRFAVTN